MSQTKGLRNGMKHGEKLEISVNWVRRDGYVMAPKWEMTSRTCRKMPDEAVNDGL